MNFVALRMLTGDRAKAAWRAFSPSSTRSAPSMRRRTHRLRARRAAWSRWSPSTRRWAAAGRR